MSSVDLLQGTLDLMILQTLVLGPAHGHTIAHAIEHRSDEVLQVEHGSLYPALLLLGGLGKQSEGSFLQAHGRGPASTCRRDHKMGETGARGESGAPSRGGLN